MSSNLMNFLPIVLLAFGALVSLACEPFLKNENKHRVIPWIGAVFILFSALSFFATADGVAYNTFAMDPFRRYLGWTILFCTFLGLGAVQTTLSREKAKGGEPYGLLLLAGCGALIMTQAVDFLSLFIGMELAAFPVYGLVGLRRKDRNGNEAAFKYFVTGAVFSAVYLYGMSLIYGATGSTHMSSAVLEGRGFLYNAGLILAVFGLLFKAGAAPVHFWVADVYRGASVAVTAFMAAVVKVGALAALASVMLGSLVTPSGAASAWNLSEPISVTLSSPLLGKILVAVAVLSIVIGAFSGLAQNSVRRILAFSAVMNAGFIVLGLLLPAYLQRGSVYLWPMVYFLITYAIASAGALAGIAAFSGKNDEKETLEGLRGAGRKKTLPALAAAVCLASLAGLPPAAGFLAKFNLFAGLFSAQMITVAIFGFALSLVAAVYYLRIAYVLFAPPKEEAGSCCCGCKSGQNSVMLSIGVALAALALLALILV